MPAAAPSSTWYEATSLPRRDRPRLDFVAEADACVVGGGLLGLTVAHELARRGWSVVVLDEGALLSGASGRNAGLVSDGYAEAPADIERRVGLEHAKALHALSREGTDLVRRSIEDLRLPGVDLVPGELRVIRHLSGVDAMRAEVDRIARNYGEAPLYWERDGVRSVLRTDRYHAGLYDARAFHIHPLNYGLGLAAEATRRGVRIYEGTPATGLDLTSIRRIVRTPGGAVRCSKIILCGSSALAPEVHRLAAGCVVAVSSFIGVTEPLGGRLAEAIRFRGAVTDTRRAGNAFRVVAGDRLLWGAGSTARLEPPRRLAERMQRDMARIFPALAGARMEHAWTGTLAYGAQRMPIIVEVEKDVWLATGFGRHGLNTTATAALVVARALTERDHAYRLFAPFTPRATFGAFGRLAARFDDWRIRRRERREERRSPA